MTHLSNLSTHKWCLLGHHVLSKDLRPAVLERGHRDIGSTLQGFLHLYEANSFIVK